MTDVELIGFSTLWVIFALLTGLIALLYRQVERAFQRSAAMQAMGLLRGTKLPDVEILTDDGARPLPLTDDDSLVISAFVTAECASCRELITALRSGIDKISRTIVLVHGETTVELRDAMQDIEVVWLANPGDAVRDFGVMLVPLVYVSRGRTILASGGAVSHAEVTELVEEASALEQSDALATVEADLEPIAMGREP